MKLFDKYLLACTNQRIPMPKDWQGSLGLSLSETKQTHAEIPAEITGYRFQQNDVLDRGYVNRQVKSMALDEEATYLLLLYLQALKEHKDVDARTYLSIGETYFSFPDYVLTVDIVKGLSYTIYGSTERPAQIRIYNTLIDEDNIYLQTTDSLDRNRPIVISTQQIVDDYLKEHNIREARMLDLDNYFEIDGLLFHYETDKVYICNYDKLLFVAPEWVADTYYEYDSDTTEYTLTASEPDNWQDAYFTYYTRAGVDPDYTYTAVEGVFDGYKHETEKFFATTSYSVATEDKTTEGYTFNCNNRVYTYAKVTEVIDGVPKVTYDGVYRILTKDDLAAVDEYYRLEIKSAVPVTVVPGAYPYTPLHRVKEDGTSEVSLTAHVAYSGDGEKYYPLKLSAAGYFGLPYSNKLIPTLLDMNITEESPVKERKLLDVLTYGENYKEKIMLNTQGIFDVDDNIGEKLVW